MKAQKNNFHHVFFEPYVGAKYSEGYRGNTILVVGHTYPCNDYNKICDYCGNRKLFFSMKPEGSYQCTSVIPNIVKEEYLAGGLNREQANTYERFERALMGKYEISKEERADLWERLAFYEFVQKATKNRTGYMKKNLYQNFLEAFNEVLNYIKPSHIIVWGNQYDFITTPAENNLETIGGTTYSWREYPIQDYGSAKMLKIHHPSQGFSWEKWHYVIEDFFTKR